MNNENREKLQKAKDDIDLALANKDFNEDLGELLFEIIAIRNQIDEDIIENYYVQVIKAILTSVNGFQVYSDEDSLTHGTIANNIKIGYEEAESIDDVFRFKCRVEEELDKRLTFLYDVFIDKFIDAYNEDKSNLDLAFQFCDFEKNYLKERININFLAVADLDASELVLKEIEKQNVTIGELTEHYESFSISSNWNTYDSTVRLFDYLFDSYKSIYEECKTINEPLDKEPHLLLCGLGTISFLSSVIMVFCARINDCKENDKKLNVCKKIVEAISFINNNFYSFRDGKYSLFLENENDILIEKYNLAVNVIAEIEPNFQAPTLENAKEPIISILKSTYKENDGNIEEYSKESSGGCYVATAVYGSYDCPEVWTLRRYRDNQLAKTWYGRLFIHIYYAISPTLVRWFGNTHLFKNMWKPKLDKMVDKLQKEGVENTPYQDRNW